MSKFYTTTAIAYVNAAPHMGHALEFILTDAIARFKRLMGDDTFFLTGTDEHGVKIYSAANKAEIEPQAFVDKNAEIFSSLKGILDLSNDDFIRTTDRERHWPACQNLWKKLVDSDDIYEKEYEGMYCEGCEAFMASRDLADGNCPIHKKPPVLVKETNYFFRLSKYSDRIAELIETDQLRIIPESRKHEILNIVKEGLHDVSFSRPRDVLPWGVDVPDDPNQVMYVWCDALTNYISALGYSKNSDNFKKYWPADLHVIGKDIVRFHAGIWIGMLLSAGVELPRAILVHGFITHNGDKMSKTLGNVVNPIDIVNRYGVEALRYYLLREIPSGRDGDFNDKLFIERYNADLANNLGNLVNRVHTLIARNEIKEFTFGLFSESYKKKVDDTWKKYVTDMNKYNIHEAIFHVWRLIDFANKKMDEEKPWSLLKENPEKGKAVLCNLLELIRHVSIMISPIMPRSSAQIRKQIGLSPQIDTKKEQGWGVVPNWNQLGEGVIIFPRIETSE
ncbi:methionine--tRNA ligase [candidate division KSB1 bacterium]